MKVAGIFVALLLHNLLKQLMSTWRRARYRAAGVRVAAGCLIRQGHGGAITIEPEASIGAGTLLICEGDSRSETTALLHIGRGTAINEYCNLRASGCAIEIGEKCLLAQFVSLIGSNHGIVAGVPIAEQPWDMRLTGVRLGDDVWIGAHAVVLPGVTIGTGAVVAAGAVVNRDVPAGEIWAGVPARRVSVRGPAESKAA